MKLSPTSVATFRQCEKKFQYRYIDEVPPLISKYQEELRFGRDVHTAISNYYSRIGPEIYPKGDIEKYISEAISRSPLSGYTEKLMFHIKGFIKFEKWRQERGWRILETEKMYENEELIGRIDALFKFNSSKAVVDFKTGYPRGITESYQIQSEIYRKLTGAGKSFFIYIIFNQRKEVPSKEETWLKEKTSKIREKIDKGKYERRFKNCESCEFNIRCFEEREGIRLMEWS